MLKSCFKTLKQRTQKAQKDKKLVSQNNRYEMLPFINLFKQNNHRSRIMCKIRFRSFFKDTHRDKAPSNKIQALTKSVNVDL